MALFLNVTELDQLINIQKFSAASFFIVPQICIQCVSQKDLVKRFCSGNYMSCRRSGAALLCDEAVLLCAEIRNTANMKVDLKLVKSYWSRAISSSSPACSWQSEAGLQSSGWYSKQGQPVWCVLRFVVRRPNAELPV